MAGAGPHRRPELADRRRRRLPRPRSGCASTTARHDGTAVSAYTEPHRLVHTGRRWYLVAWDVDRAGLAHLPGRPARPAHADRPPVHPARAPPDPDLAGTPRGGLHGAYRYRARLTVHAPAALVAERITPAVGALEAVDDPTCPLPAGSDSLSEIALYVGLWGSVSRCTSPPTGHHIHELSARLTAAVAASPDERGWCAAPSGREPTRAPDSA